MQRICRVGVFLVSLSLSGPVVVSSQAQTDAAEFVYERQRTLIRAVFADIESGSPERQLAGLQLAELLLEPNEEYGESVWAEDAIGFNLLTTLDQLAQSNDNQVRASAAELLSLITSELELGEVINNARSVALTGARSEVLGEGEYDSWLRVNLQEGLEYRVQTFECFLVGVVALAGDGQTVLAGGTAVGNRFGFISSISGPAYLRVRSPLCPDSGDIALSAGIPAVEVDSATSVISAWPVETGRSYVGRLGAGAEQWFQLPSTAGARYVFEASPLDNNLDTYITAYGADGQTVLGEDDDGGIGLGSRLDLSTVDDGDLFIRIHELGGDPGRYDLTVSAWQSLIDAALPLTLGTEAVGRLALEEDEWWRVEVDAGQRYRIEVTPRDALDTYLTLYDKDGITILGEDDDGGEGLGSRLEFARETDETLLIRIGRLDRDIGTYGLVISERIDPVDIAEPAVPGVSYQAELAEDGEHWWSLDLPPGRYVLEARPTDGLDTVIALYDADGVDELDIDDDGGDGLGSRLELRTSARTRHLIRVYDYSGSAGGFEFSVSEEADAGQDATPIVAGTPQQASLTSGGDQWWTLETRVRSEYTIEAIPLGDVDTVLTIYDASGLTQLDSDDDGGPGLGSRLDYLADRNQPILIRVQGFGDSQGDFEIVVSETEVPLILPFQ